jgi:hypothetical protein
MKKILHIAYDNSSQDYFFKFLCEERPDEQNIILLFIKEKVPQRVTYYSHENIHIHNIADTLSVLDNYLLEDFKLLVIHFLKIDVALFISRDKHKIKIAWAFWGADGYMLNLVSKLYSKETNSLSAGDLSSKDRRYLKIKGLLTDVLIRIRCFEAVLLRTNGLIFFKSESIVYKGLKNVDFCLTHVKADFFLIKKRFPLLNFTWKNFFYLPQSESELSSSDTMNNGYLMVGNSGDPTNNHIDIFNRLSTLEPKSIKVICPFSYGATDEYLRNLELYCKEKMGFDVDFLTNFESLETWETRLKPVSVVFFNHNRQQGFGNAVSLLRNGKRLYLNGRSNTYKHLKEIGCIVSDIQNDKIEVIALSDEEKEINRKCIEKAYSSIVFRDNWEALILSV